jgi:hypothetical protein
MRGWGDRKGVGVGDRKGGGEMEMGGPGPHPMREKEGGCGQGRGVGRDVACGPEPIRMQTRRDVACGPELIRMQTRRDVMCPVGWEVADPSRVWVWQAGAGGHVFQWGGRCDG